MVLRKGDESDLSSVVSCDGDAVMDAGVDVGAVDDKVDVLGVDVDVLAAAAAACCFAACSAAGKTDPGISAVMDAPPRCKLYRAAGCVVAVGVDVVVVVRATDADADMRAAGDRARDADADADVDVRLYGSFMSTYPYTRNDTRGGDTRCGCQLDA